MRRFSIAICIVLASLHFCLAAHAQDVTVTGEIQETEGDIRHAKGDAVLIYKDMKIEADEITENAATGDVTAGPHVKMTREFEHIEGDRLEMNLSTKTGTIYDADGYMGPGYYFTASQVDRLEDERYLLHNAIITTCDAKIPGWSFHVHRALVTPGDNFRASNGVFNLEGFPVFYLPYVEAPALDRERATGFLIPSTATSTIKGRSVRESFFWAINRSVDATFTGEYFTSRGPAGGVEFRAAPNRNSRLEMNSFFVDDRLGQGGLSLQVLDYVDLSNGYRAVATANLVTSLVYRQVYGDGLSAITLPIETSQAFLTRNEPGYSYNFGYDRSAVFFVDQPTTVMSKAPSFEGSIPERRLGSLPVYFTMDGGVAGIGRRDAAINTSGLEARFDAHPALEIPVLDTPALKWSNEIGAEDTDYTASRGEGSINGPAYNRLSFDYYSLVDGPHLERDYGRWRHVFEPSLEYRYVTGVDNFQNTIVVDNTDLATNTNEVQYAITNRLYTTREVFSWQIAQDRFFDSSFGGAAATGQRNAFQPLLDLTGFAFADGPRRFSPIVSTMRFSTTPSASTDLQVDYDTEKHRFDAAGIIGGITHGQTTGGIAYYFRSNSDIQFPANQFQGTIQYGNALKRGFSFAFRVAYDIQNALFQGSLSEVRYNTDCYGLSVELSQYDVGARKESRVLFAFTLKNIGSYGTITRQDRLF